MTARIGIRLEDKNAWEARTPLIPDHVRTLKAHHDIDVCVQSSPIRAFNSQEYVAAGAAMTESLEMCPIIFAVKEIPEEVLEPGKTYVFFSHTIKGQKANMPMLQKLLDLGCQLIDYEKIVDAHKRRLVFFGNYAGLAGMIDTLWALGKRLAWEGISTPFEDIQQALAYKTLDDAQTAIAEVGRRIAAAGLPESLSPLICGFAGYGNVSRGAQTIYDLLPVQEISPEALRDFTGGDRHHVYKVIFKEKDLVLPKNDQAPFQLQDYYDHPEHYRGRFADYLPHLTVLVNAIYWTRRYPRLVTEESARALFDDGRCPLRVIGDISCDVKGAIEITVRTTHPGAPIFVYDPRTGQLRNGYEGPGIVVLAVDNLPCELPREASRHFSTTLLPFVPEIAAADYTAPLAESGLSPTLQHAVIVWQGELTPPYRYLEQHLK
ncbi:MAG: hypothetical protein JXB35_13480 [Anaerolineae bacterium]|nr:hypothetical protein [Anaerolineae bacterium]